MCRAELEQVASERNAIEGELDAAKTCVREQSEKVTELLEKLSALEAESNSEKSRLEEQLVSLSGCIICHGAMRGEEKQMDCQEIDCRGKYGVND